MKQRQCHMLTPFNILLAVSPHENNTFPLLKRKIFPYKRQSGNMRTKCKQQKPPYGASRGAHLNLLITIQVPVTDIIVIIRRR